MNIREIAELVCNQNEGTIACTERLKYRLEQWDIFSTKGSNGEVLELAADIAYFVSQSVRRVTALFTDEWHIVHRLTSENYMDGSFRKIGVDVGEILNPILEVIGWVLSEMEIHESEWGLENDFYISDGEVAVHMCFTFYIDEDDEQPKFVPDEYQLFTIDVSELSAHQESAIASMYRLNMYLLEQEIKSRGLKPELLI